MNVSRRWGTLVCLIGVGVVPSLAQVPGADEFARHPQISGVALSPSGKYVALSVPMAEGTETQLHVVPLDGSGEVHALRFGNQQHVTNAIWTDDEQIVVSRARMEPLHARPYSYGELMSTDIVGKNQDTMFGYIPDDGTRSGRRKDQGFARVAKVLGDEPGKVLVEFTCWRHICGEESPTVVFKVDTRTGKRNQIERSERPASFSFDSAGRARLRVTEREGNPVLHYRPGADQAWLPVPTSLAGYSMDALRFEPDGNTAYAIISDRQEPAQLYRVDFSAGSRTLLIGREDAEVSRLLAAGPNDAPFGVVFDSDKPMVRYIDTGSEWVKLHAGLLKAFPGQMIEILDHSRDDSKVLFYVWSDRNPGGYYVLHRGDNRVQLINESRPWIKAEQMAVTRPVEFQSADGLKIFGFYTAPNGKTGSLPLVVMPHGGPHGVYDAWGYDSDAQFLASRGYAVLQVNFRGSGGRGQRFERLGYRQWGGKVMDDLSDGVRWAVQNKLADPARICTYGASFGGYAAMMNPIRNPGLYKCAIGYVGVYDLQVMQKAGDINDTENGRQYLDRVLGNDQAQLIAYSPARNVDKIGVPVLLVQGTLDKRVPMDQFNALKQALQKSDVPVQTLVKTGEGHGFYKAANRAELYRNIEKFLDQNIGH
ncbi:MAG: S9 family peptidase [Burkholderiales bacterium]|nr:MAG: S9 family peptidase [Burkholderiales bacterium]